LAACQKEVIRPNQPVAEPVFTQQTTLNDDNSSAPNPNAVSSNNDPDGTMTSAQPDTLGGGITDPLHKRDQRDKKSPRND
jgi:hypothetical protein